MIMILDHVAGTGGESGTPSRREYREIDSDECIAIAGWYDLRTTDQAYLDWQIRLSAAGVTSCTVTLLMLAGF